MFLLTVLVLGAKNLQKLPNRYRHLRLSFATYNSDWSKVSDVSEPLRNTCDITEQKKFCQIVASSLSIWQEKKIDKLSNFQD